MIIGHIEKEREKVSFSFFKQLGIRLDSQATFKLALDNVPAPAPPEIPAHTRPKFRPK
jgi:hypothetical protein